MARIQKVDAEIKRLGMARRIYIYEVDGLLIDTGPYYALKMFLPFFESNSIEQIAVTHLHEDHSGNAHWWWQNKKTPIYIHPLSVEETSKKGKFPLYRRWFWGPRLPFKSLPYPDFIETDHHQFQIIYTPGHSDDHVTLYEKNEGWLFTGDLYISPKPKLFLKEESIPKTITSLIKLLNLDFETLYCAHSGEIEHGRSKLQSKLNYLLELRENILNLHQKGWEKKEIVKNLFPKRTPIIYLSNKEFSYCQAIDSVLHED